jgi:hypothetical protein
MAGIAKERRITSTNTLEMSFFMKSPPNIFLLLKIQQLCSLLFTHKHYPKSDIKRKIILKSASSSPGLIASFGVESTFHV